tara:strand:+ start:13 stop:867 length:855 start_codon:yes stop_codon:yes gene_type:complete
MAEEQEGLPPNPAQMMIQGNRDRALAAAQAGMAKRAAVEEGRTASGRQAAEDIGDFTPEDEPFEMEGATAPKEKAASKYFKGAGGFEYLHDPKTGAFTITNAPKNYAHLKGKNVTSGKAYDSIMAEMETGQSLYEEPKGGATLSKIGIDPLSLVSDESGDATKVGAYLREKNIDPATVVAYPLTVDGSSSGYVFLDKTNPNAVAEFNESVAEGYAIDESAPMEVSYGTPGFGQDDFLRISDPTADPATMLASTSEAEADEKRRAEQAAVERGGRMTGSMDNPFG